MIQLVIGQLTVSVYDRNLSCSDESCESVKIVAVTTAEKVVVLILDSLDLQELLYYGFAKAISSQRHPIRQIMMQTSSICPVHSVWTTPWCRLPTTLL